MQPEHAQPMKKDMLGKSKEQGIILIVVILTAIIGSIYFIIPDGIPQKKVNALGRQQKELLTIALVNNQDHIQGNPKAKITIIEYSDFECPDCQYFQPTIKQVLMRYGSKISWVVRHYPLPQHKNAEKEAEAVECASELGGNSAYWKYNDIIFTRSASGGTGFPLTNLVPLAKEIGLDQNAFQQCLDSGKYTWHIQQNTREAQNALIHQLPSTVIIDQQGNRQLITGNQPFTVVQTILDQLLSQ